MASKYTWAVTVVEGFLALTILCWLLMLSIERGHVITAVVTGLLTLGLASSMVVYLAKGKTKGETQKEAKKKWARKQFGRSKNNH